MKFLFDNDISFRLPAMLSALGVDAIALRDVMPASTKDPEFLAVLKTVHGADVFVSGDTRQRRNEIESRLLKASGVTSLYFGPFWAKLTFWSQAQWLVKNWPNIEAFARSSAIGTCADIQQKGRMKLYQF